MGFLAHWCVEISSPEKIVGKKFQISLYSVPEYVCALEEHYLFSGTSLSELEGQKRASLWPKLTQLSFLQYSLWRNFICVWGGFLKAYSLHFNLIRGAFLCPCPCVCWDPLLAPQACLPIYFLTFTGQSVVWRSHAWLGLCWNHFAASHKHKETTCSWAFTPQLAKSVPRLIALDLCQRHYICALDMVWKHKTCAQAGTFCCPTLLLSY